MTAFNNVIGTRTPFTFSGLTTLANGTYVAGTAVDFHAFFTSPNRAPLDIILELEVTPGTVAGNKQAWLFAQVSMDGTNYTTGPASGTTTTDELNLIRIGRLPLNTNATQQRMAWSALSRIELIPWAIKPVVLNDSGAAFSAGAVYYTVVSGDGT